MIRAFGKIVLILCLIVALALAGGFMWLRHYADAPGPLAQDSVILIAPGAGLGEIARQLEAAQFIDHQPAFRLLAMTEGAHRRLQAGEYAYPAGVTPRGILDKMLRGDVVIRQVTIPEGLTSAQVAALLRDAEGLTGELGAVPEEGTILPDTYRYQRGDDIQAVLQHMQSAMQEYLRAKWENRQAELPYETPQEALIMASIIEKETGISEERGLVASVFINRLKLGMRLQADPTVIYGITEGLAPLSRSLTRADLQRDTPYNSYTRTGLPKGPIANPGRASIDAALNPPPSPYIYFVADGTGGHIFAATLEQHNVNVAKWRKARQAAAAAEPLLPE